MNRRLSEHCQNLRQEALRRAGDELRRGAFASPDGTRWTGQIDREGKTGIRVRVELPPEFPDTLPKIFVDQPLEIVRRPHIGKDHKICIAPDTGLLLDTEHPERLVEESIERAQNVLFPVDDVAQSRDLEAEFQAYWTEEEGTGILSICVPANPTGQIVLGQLGQAGNPRILLAPTLEIARKWADATRMPLAELRAAYFVRLTSLFPPPGFDTRTSLDEMLRLVEARASTDIREKLEDWLKANGLPRMVLLSAPLTDRSSNTEFAVTVPQLSGEAAKNAQRGFRPGHVPGAREVGFARPLPVRRMEVARGDQAYVLARGGGNPNLLARRVTVVGCGAVGSHAAGSLAASGVGSLLLIDPEELESGNIHRHLLGAADLGQKKVEALAVRLRERFPQASIEAVARKIEEVLEEKPEMVTGTDLVFVALGDETLELRLNDFLGDAVGRIHVWLEPLGLGGHVLATGIRSRPGCLDCLYHRDASGLMVNMAGLAEPNQQFQKNLGGCRGTFTPYGVLDAQRAAVEAVRESIRLMTEPEPQPALTSWVVSAAAFVESGLRLSSRGRPITPGTLLARRDFARPDCRVCGQDGQ